MFPSDDESSVIYTLYNDTDETITGELLVHNYSELQVISELWHEQPVKVDMETGRISGEVNAKELAVIRMTRA
ncbi:hypothetical protein D3C85_1389110 [compost metagenome]